MLCFREEGGDVLQSVSVCFILKDHALHGVLEQITTDRFPVSSTPIFSHLSSALQTFFSIPNP